MSDTTENRPDSILKKLKNNRIISVFIVFGIILSSIATFTDSFEKIWGKAEQLFAKDGFEVEGEILFESGAPKVENILVTILWGLDRSTEEGGDTSFQSSIISKVTSDDGQLSYRLQLTKLPPEEVLMDLNGTKLGIGLLVAIDDANDNGIYDTDERLIGISGKNCITFLNGDFKSFAESRDMKIWKKLEQGYQLNDIIPPTKHGLDTIFDDLFPTDIKPVNIVIPRGEIKYPNLS